MKVLVISSRDLEKGSTKYRIAQYQGLLGANGIELEYAKRGDCGRSLIERASQADLVFNQKCLFRASLARRLLAVSRHTLFDFDDAIYTRPGTGYSWFTGFKVRRRLRLWLDHADAVTAANEYLAAYARQYSRNVEVVPMAIDMETWQPAERKPDERVTIGWAGSPVNVPRIERIGPILAEITRRFPAVRIAVYSGRRPSLPCSFEYREFHPGTEAAFVRRLDIGLLPLTRDAYSAGKSPIKAIQYLACGVPVVGDSIGATREILNPANSIAVTTEDEWLHALEALITDPGRRGALGKAARQAAVADHDVRTVGHRLLAIIGRLSERPPIEKVPS